MLMIFVMIYVCGFSTQFRLVHFAIMATLFTALHFYIEHTLQTNDSTHISAMTTHKQTNEKNECRSSAKPSFAIRYDSFHSNYQAMWTDVFVGQGTRPCAH